MTNFAVSFAKGSRKPAQNFAIKICIACLTVDLLSQLLANIINNTQLPLDVPLRITAIIITGIAFTLCGLFLLVTQQSQDRELRSFDHIVRLMPLPRSVRFFAQIASSLLVAGLLIIFGYALLKSVAVNIQQSFAALEVYWVLGVFSGLGLMYVKWLPTRFHKVVFFVALCTLTVMAIEKVYTSSQSLIVDFLPFLLWLLLVLPIIGLIQQYYQGYNLKISIKNQYLTKLLPEVLPYKLWLLVKLWRNPNSRNSYLVSLLLSSLMALVITIRHRVFTDVYPVLLFSSLLAATFSTEIRGLFRRYSPPEVALVSGLRHLVVQQVLITYMMGLSIGLPLYFSINGQAINPFLLGAQFICMQAYAVATGQFIGSVFVPTNGETGTQFFASFIASILIVLLPKYTHAASNDFGGALTWLLGAFLMSAMVYVTELIRRKNHGRVR